MVDEVRRSRLIYGCMGLGGSWEDGSYDDGAVRRAQDAVEAALEAGIDRFDHADIYRRGSAETVFGEVLRRSPGLRDRVVVQGKVGIRLAEPGAVAHYDLSAGAIRARVLESLRRLGTDRLDVLLLHRPDPLLEPDEVAEAVAGLQRDGLVGEVGASNMSAAQLAELQRALPTPLVADQLEMSLARHGFVDSAILVNHPEGAGVDFPHGTLEHCRRHGIELQAWGSLAGGRYSGATQDDQPAAAVVSRMAEEHGVEPEAVVLGWLMRHPARIAPVIGTTNPGRIRACAAAERVAAAMTRVEWYELLGAARGRPVP
ncbi:putative oxidoreductase [Nocardioides thalensis]|uniref:Putative oxidoreductase n=1 Tax=Nocardioides thalensis TaxID=1914755 RepID=A0A853C6T4_9ACTN|nr:putative oxidoreductase [Nocardioides thalensis]